MSGDCKCCHISVKWNLKTEAIVVISEYTVCYRVVTYWTLRDLCTLFRRFNTALLWQDGEASIGFGVTRPTCPLVIECVVFIVYKEICRCDVLSVVLVWCHQGKDTYPFPRIDDCLDTLEGSTWFSTTDFRSGYHQVASDGRDADKTTFVTRRGILT